MGVMLDQARKAVLPITDNETTGVPKEAEIWAANAYLQLVSAVSGHCKLPCIPSGKMLMQGWVDFASEHPTIEWDLLRLHTHKRTIVASIWQGGCHHLFRG